MRTLRFLTLMLTALSMGMAFSHLLEMPAKLAYQGAVWLMRAQWEYSYSMRAVLQIAAFAALVVSVLVETPRSVRASV